MTPEEYARQAAMRMMTNDAATQSLGARLLEIRPGFACMSMLVRPEMLNGHGICHGGVIFTLADSAFAFACNSHNLVAVAQTNQITYVDRAHVGAILTAEAREMAKTGRSGTYDVTVTAEDGRTIALFRGLSRQLSGVHVPNQSEEDA